MAPSGSAVLIALFFVQGLAFYTMSVSILIVDRPRAALAITRHLWLLAAFGFAHSAAAWVELAQQILPVGGTVIDLIHPVPTVLMVLYSVLLAQFGANLISALRPDYRWIRPLPLVLLLWAVIPATFVCVQGGLPAPQGLVTAEAIARYVLYLPAGLASALALYLQGKAPAFDRLPNLRRDCRLASLAFALYAVSGGILVPTSILFSANTAAGVPPSAIAQLPVQIVRLLLAPVIAWVVVRTLRVFEVEHLLEVEDLNRQLQRLTRSAVTAQEEERKRISLELHDDTAQLLSSLLVRLKLLQGVQNLQDLGARCAELMSLASEATESIRRMATQLRPVALDDLGLVAAIQWYIERFTRREGLQVQLKASGCKARIDPETELVVYRIVQESLRNVAKHAQASSVAVSLEIADNKLRLSVKDDGIGFDPLAVRRSESAGMGLLGMSERAALVGGTMSVRSQPGSGTTVRVEIPLKVRASREAKEMVTT